MARNTKDLTPAMIDAISLAIDGFIPAGEQVRNGRVCRVNARTIDGLIARGLAVRRYSSEGGVACLLIEENR